MAESVELLLMEINMKSALPEKLQPQYEEYIKPREETDLDLVTIVRTMLIDSGLMQQVLAAYDTDRFILEARNRPSEAQRFLLNRYWSYQLMKSDKSSIEERTYLIPNGEVSDWLRMFQAKILPFIIENNLPTP